jgi:predicted acylesterase/phospholipase RssA
MTFRVLSLDGGGVWALIQVRALIELYGANAPGRQVLQDFDLVAGTSGGSIVLGGLVENVTLETLLGYFEDEKNRKAIFSPTHQPTDQIIYDATGIGPRYSAQAKLPALERLMPNTGTALLPNAAAGIRRPGANADVHLLITAFDYDRNRARFFRSAPASGPGWGEGTASNVTLAEAIHASSNAPVLFFDEPAEFDGGRYWDGAITGCNNPILAAVAEAVVLGNHPTTVVGLSLGSGTKALAGPPIDNPPSPFVQARPNQTLFNDLATLAGSVTDEPPDIASFLAHVMTGGGADVPKPADSRIVRMNPLISPIKNAAGEWAPPAGFSLAQFKYFSTLPMDAIEPAQIDYIVDYAMAWLNGSAPNQPLRMNGDTLAVELGFGLFQQAAAAWQAVR